MAFWPESLIAEIAERRCVPFIGAGLSSGCKDPQGNRPPEWNELLKTALPLVTQKEDREEAQRLIDRELLLDAAEIIFSNIVQPDIRDYFRRTFLTPGFQATKIHEHIRDLDPKVVVTTNYDQIYENFCKQGQANEGYSVLRYHDDNILDEIRSTARVIIKAHGCISDTSKIVLTRSQYFKAKQKHPCVYNILDSLFLVNTILFLGCGLSDPDIQLVLENTNIAVPSNHPHYALVPKGRHPSFIQAIKLSYNIQLIEYECTTGDHSQAEIALSELVEKVCAYRATYP